MYKKYFSLDELPFDGLPSSSFYYVGSVQHQALEILTDNLSHNGSICVLSGASGSGKTTLVRMLIRSLPKRMRVITIDDPRLDEHMLLATILRASGVVATSFESIAELTLKLRKFLEKSQENGLVTTVICDEAQGLTDNVLEQIRLISNIEGDLGKMINFLLVGQEELVEHIQKPMHKMLWSRVKAFAILKPLKKDEVQAYINFRMQMAGCHDPVFSARAVSAIYKGSKGLPRLINSIADRALYIAFENQKPHVSAHLVKKAVEIVRFKKSLFALGFKNFVRHLLKILLVKIPIFALGLMLAAASFYACYKFLPHYLDSESIEASVNQDEFIKTHYEKSLTRMYPGLNNENKEWILFKQAKQQALFKGQAIDRLIKLWGYARADEIQASCEDIKSKELFCKTIVDDFSYLKYINRLAIVLLRDENLIPYYAILYKLEGDKAQIILGQYIFTVKTKFLEQAFDGEISYIYTKPLEDELDITNYQKALQRFKSLGEDIKLGQIKSIEELKADLALKKEQLDEEIIELILDNASLKGRYLED